LGMSNWWDLAYSNDFIPWHSDTPTKELVDLVESGRIKPCKVIDIGCGLATNSIYLAKKGFIVTGIDISAVAISRAKQRAKMEGVSISFYNIDFTKTETVSKIGKFDLAIDIGCYHSLASKNERERYFESLNKILNNGGKYLLWAFSSKDAWKGGPPGIDENEIEIMYDKKFSIIERKLIDTSFRMTYFYYLQKL